MLAMDYVSSSNKFPLEISGMATCPFFWGVASAGLCVSQGAIQAKGLKSACRGIGRVYICLRQVQQVPLPAGHNAALLVAKMRHNPESSTKKFLCGKG